MRATGPLNSTSTVIVREGGQSSNPCRSDVARPIPTDTARNTGCPACVGHDNKKPARNRSPDEASATSGFGIAGGRVVPAFGSRSKRARGGLTRDSLVRHGRTRVRLRRPEHKPFAGHPAHPAGRISLAQSAEIVGIAVKSQNSPPDRMIRQAAWRNKMIVADQEFFRTGRGVAGRDLSRSKVGAGLGDGGAFHFRSLIHTTTPHKMGTPATTNAQIGLIADKTAFSF